jgi:hypothetical protein
MHECQYVQAAFQPATLNKEMLANSLIVNALRWTTMLSRVTTSDPAFFLRRRTTAPCCGHFRRLISAIGQELNPPHVLTLAQVPRSRP